MLFSALCFTWNINKNKSDFILMGKGSNDSYEC